MERLKKLSVFYTFFDIVFCAIFLILVFIKHDHSLILYFFAIIVLLSYYALWSYALQIYSGEHQYLKDNEWHRKKTSIVSLFTLFRVVLFMTVFFSCVVSTSNLDVLKVIEDFDTVTKVLLCFMIVALIISGVLSAQITLIHDSHARIIVPYSNIVLKPVTVAEEFNGKTAEEVTKDLTKFL